MKVRVYRKGCSNKCRVIPLSTKMISQKIFRVKESDRHRSKIEY